MNHKKTALAFLALFFLALLTPLAHADDMGMNDFAEWFGATPNDYVKARSYIGVVGISADINNGGDFNGLTTVEYGPVTYQTTPVTLWTNPELDQVPSINRNFGFGILLGQRLGPWAFELSFWQSTHTATYTGGGFTVTNPATLQSFDFNVKRYIFTQLPTQPFFSVGVSLPWLSVADGSEILNAQNGEYNVIAVNSETLSGIGLQLGVGLEIYLSNNFSLVGGAYQRWTEFNQINGAEKVSSSGVYFDGDSSPTLPSGASNVGSLEGDGINFYVGTTIGFE